MTNSKVIASAPWISAVGSGLLVVSLYTSGPTSDLACALALATLSACLGALITHYPK